MKFTREIVSYLSEVIKFKHKNIEIYKAASLPYLDLHFANLFDTFKNLIIFWSK